MFILVKVSEGAQAQKAQKHDLNFFQAEKSHKDEFNFFICKLQSGIFPALQDIILFFLKTR